MQAKNIIVKMKISMSTKLHSLSTHIQNIPYLTIFLLISEKN